MGSRRRPSQRSQDEDLPRGRAADIPHDLQLLPNVKKGTRSHEIQDCLGHQKWHIMRKPAIHPALTDFGPESLKRFIENEHAKLRDRVAKAIVDTQQDQDEQLRRFARDLVNAQTNIYLAKENGQKTFKISKTKSNTRRNQENNSSSDKGKAAVRRIPQNDGSTLSTENNFQVIPSFGTHEHKNFAVPASRGLKRSMFQSLSTGTPGSRGSSASSKTKPAGSRPMRLGGFDTPPQSIPSKGNAVQPLRRSLRTTATRLIAAEQMELAEEGLGRDVEMLDDVYSGQDDNPSTAIPQSSTEITKPEHKSEVLLTRTSSFETHASSSRVSLRSRGKSLSSGTQLPGESHRRRKTPATIHLDQNNSNDLALRRPSRDLHHQDISLGVSTSRIMDSAPRTGIENYADMESIRPYVPAGSQPYGERSLSLGYGVPRIRSGDYGTYFPPEYDSTPIEDEYGAGTTPDVSSRQYQEQAAILASITDNKPTKRMGRRGSIAGRPMHFDYAEIVPEEMPMDIRQAEINRCKIWQAHGFNCHGELVSSRDDSRQPGPFTDAQLDPRQENLLNAPSHLGDYRRKFTQPPLAPNPGEPPFCPASRPNTSLPFEFWEAGVLQYLSSAEVRSLRLVCRSLAQDLEPFVFRSVVAKFDPTLFSLNPSYHEDGKIDIDTEDSMLKKHGPTMNKFGISFEVDLHGLMHAPFKNTEKTVDAWFGRYKWPITDYPYFPALRNIDKLLDDERRLLTQAMSNLGKCSELAISVDSGHGWLEGPDTSDLALYRDQTVGGSRIFGKAFSAVDRAYENGMKQLFTWAQINTINENIKYLEGSSSKVREELETLRRIIIRNYESYREERTQPDYTRYLHTGGLATVQNVAQAQNAAVGNVGNPAHPLAQQINQLTQQMNTAPPPQNPNNHLLQQRFASVMNLVRNHLPVSDTQKKGNEQKREGIQPQWPIIFNGFNLSAESRGDTRYVQSRVATPSDYPLLPNSLNESQAQWIMETSWIQRTFLSAYTDAVRLNSLVLKNVHSLHIAKLSSGLLPALSQKAFWAALSGLRKVTIMIKPDWRVEHIPGDKYFQSTMATDPVYAAHKFAEVLRDYVTRLENLNSLHVGYVGGGEHQTGIFGRNQHILPAPITSNPREWLIAQNASMAKPSGNTMFTFPHIRTLTFENCWFSPYMLETFMRKSHDTSLHNLVLDSVSLTAQINSTRTDGPLRTIENGLKCQHTPSAWLNETVPANASWANTLDKITPGNTFLDSKYDAGMINEEESPRPERQFRGNIQQITLKSCGYVKILGIPSNEFNQNELVFQNTTWSAMDDGLKTRSCMFTKTIHHQAPSRPVDNDRPDGTARLRRSRTSTSANTPWTIGSLASTPDRQQHNETQVSVTSLRPIMLAGRQGHARGENVAHADGGSSTTMTGFLTQCIHPVEKRILERMWGMRFGWGDDMRRWEAVEDGWFMGGTGRFSGDVFRDQAQQESVALPVEEDTEDEEVNSDQSTRSNTGINSQSTLGHYGFTAGTTFPAADGAAPSVTPDRNQELDEGNEDQDEGEDNVLPSGDFEDEVLSEEDADFHDLEDFAAVTED